MSFESLASDFYGFEDLLTDREKDFLMTLRGALETEIKPIVNEYWEKAEFPHRIVEVLHRNGAIGLGFPETAPFENSAVFRGWVALELARVDASVSTYVGVQNGLAVGEEVLEAVEVAGEGFEGHVCSSASCGQRPPA